MVLAISSALLLIGIFTWLAQEECSTHLEINNLISVIERLEQEQQLLKHFQLQSKKL